jgi:Asp-tRNA(Asn)/Glu-tRNA(Gln) amidotransferase A subunit family amidase
MVCCSGGEVKFVMRERPHESVGATGCARLDGIAEGKAFVESVEVDPTGSGPLDGLSFAVKDLIDIGGHKTGCGNPSWRDTHPPASVNAVCVEQLLDAWGKR